MCVFYGTMLCHVIVWISLYRTVKLHLHVCSYYGLRLSNLIKETTYLLTLMLRIRLLCANKYFLLTYLIMNKWMNRMTDPCVVSYGVWFPVAVWWFRLQTAISDDLLYFTQLADHMLKTIWYHSTWSWSFYPVLPSSASPGSYILLPFETRMNTLLPRTTA